MPDERKEFEELTIKFGKGLWAKIPAEGHTTVTKPERTDGVDGEIVWENRKDGRQSQRTAGRSIKKKRQCGLPRYISYRGNATASA